MRRWLLWAWAALAGAGCAAVRPGPGGAGEALVGLTARVSARAAPSLAFDGAASGQPATLHVDLASSLSRASAACFGSAGPKARGTVRFRRASGAAVELPEAWLAGVELGGRRLGRRLVAVEPGGAGCDVWLGTEALGAVALEVDLAAGTVTFTPARARATYPAAIDLDRDPTTDRLLVPVRLRAAGVELSAPFVLSTAEPRSSVSSSATAGNGPALLSLEPGAQVEIALAARPDWTSTAAAGELGPDVWGRFRARIDLGSSVLVLQHPPPVAGPARREEQLPPEPEPGDPTP